MPSGTGKGVRPAAGDSVKTRNWILKDIRPFGLGTPTDLEAVEEGRMLGVSDAQRLLKFNFTPLSAGLRPQKP